MRRWSMIVWATALIAASALVETPAQAQQRNWCRASVAYGTTTHHYSGMITLPGYPPSSSHHRRMREEFEARIRSTARGHVNVTCHANIDHDLERSISQSQASGYQVVRTGWTANYMGETTQQRASSSGVGREPGVYVTLPTRQDAGPQADSVQDSEASQRAVAARYRRQQNQVRRIADENARQQAAHQAQVAEAARQRAAHRTAMADNARQQEAYRRSRADWEAEMARCRAARSCAVPR